MEFLYVQNGKSANGLGFVFSLPTFLVISFCNLCNKGKKWMRKNKDKVYVSRGLPR